MMPACSALPPSIPTRIGRVVSRPRSRRSVSRSVTTVVFSVLPSTSPKGCLVPSIPIPNATTHRCSPKWTPSIINATRSRLPSGAASSSPRAVSVIATNRRETADLLAAQGDRPALTTVAHRCALRVMFAARSARRGDVGLHQRAHHLQAGADGEGEKALTHVLGDLLHRDRHGIGYGDLWPGTRLGHGFLIVLGHGGPLLGWCLGDAQHLPHGRLQAGDRHSSSTRPGTTLSEFPACSLLEPGGNRLGTVTRPLPPGKKR